jgi:hypothetical protein
MGFVKKIPDALLGGIPSAVGAVAGGYMQSKAANKATEASERASQQALAYEREKEARRRQEYDRASAQALQQWNAWNQNRMEALRYYGYNMPQAQPMAQAMPQQAPMGQQMPQAGMPQGQSARMNPMTQQSPMRQGNPYGL